MNRRVENKSNKPLYARVEVLSTAVLIGDTEIRKEKLHMEEKFDKNSIW